MWLISLLFLSLSSTLFATPYGIQHYSVEPGDLESKGCSVCYQTAYHEVTTSNDILSCAGPVLFVGSQELVWDWDWEAQAHLGAFGLASEVHNSTILNTPHLSNGAYWYFTPGKSFGFLKDTDLHQEPTADIGTTNPESRLSWNLSKYGGYRVGNNLRLSETVDYYRKRIYNCPNNF